MKTDIDSLESGPSRLGQGAQGNGEGLRSDRTGAQLKRTSPAPPIGIPLSAREYEIGLLVIEGCSNFEISRQLGISDLTVKKHVENILRKLNARNRIVAAIWLYQAAERIGEAVATATAA